MRPFGWRFERWGWPAGRRGVWIGVQWERTVDLAHRPPVLRLTVLACLVPLLPVCVVLRKEAR